MNHQDDEHHHGPRRSALEQRRHRQRVRATAWAVVAAVIAVAIGTTAILMSVGGPDDGEPEALPSASPSGPSVSTTLMIGTRTDVTDDAEVAWVALLAFDAERGEGAVGYIPARTAVEVPGRGLQGLSDAYESGGVPLLLVTAENLLGISIDRYVEISDGDFAAIAQQITPLTVDVPTEVRVPAGPGTNRVLFTTGPQSLSADFLERLLFTLGTDDDDVSLGARHIAFWDALFDRFSDAPNRLTEALTEAAGALSKSDAPSEELIEQVTALTGLPSGSRILRSLTVSPLEVPGASLYVADPEAVGTFVAEVAGDEAAAADQTRVQILNGNGVPGIGQEVATRLVGEGFRVILSGNARRLDHERTLIIVYDSTGESRALAERARELLGVGEVQVSTQDQGIVDITIVVGKDFLRTR
ncbi:MAG: LCP family protein [Actinomycetota bacterium]